MTKSIYSDYKNLLFPIALNMLGNPTDAEDLVQETMLKWLSLEKDHIQNVKGYLVKTLINKCLNFIRDQKKKEQSDIEIAPELLIDHLPAYIENRDSLSLGLLAMLEKLSAMERAVFLLKEIFGYSHKEIADILDINEVYCRQILSRARRHLQNDRQRFQVSPERHLHLVKTFVEVCEGENLSGLLEILKEDIELDISRPAASLRGNFVVAEYLLGLYRLGYGFQIQWLNQLPAIVVYLLNKPAMIIHLEGDDVGIDRIQVEMVNEGISIAPLF